MSRSWAGRAHIALGTLLLLACRGDAGGGPSPRPGSTPVEEGASAARRAAGVRAAGSTEEMRAAGTRAAGVPASGTAAARVVSLHDVTTEIVVGLGAVGALVGVSDGVDLEPEVSAAIARVPRVAGLESVLCARPTLVLGMAVVAARDPDLVAALRGRGVTVVLGDPRTLPDVFTLIDTIATHLHRDPTPLTTHLQKEAATSPNEKAAAAPPIEKTTANPTAWTAASGPSTAASRPSTAASRPLTASGPSTAANGPSPTAVGEGEGRGEGLRVFVYDCCDPAFTAGGRALLTDLLARAGARNVFGDLDMAWGKVGWEDVLARRPDVVIISDYQMGDQGDVAQKRARLSRMQALATLPVVTLPLGEALGGIRSVAGLARLRRAFADLRAVDRRPGRRPS